MTASASTPEGKATPPVCAYMLADHLDAALAAGEDLLAIDYLPSNEGPVITTQSMMAARAAQRAVVERIRGLELAIVARILKARERAKELAALDTRFKTITNLFVAGTAVIEDAIAECCDATLQDFDTADAFPAYLRSRGLLGEDVYALSEHACIITDENFLVARRIALGPLLDLVASFIDALDLHFELYADEDVERSNEAGATPTQPEATP